jgi:hypothetical protein
MASGEIVIDATASPDDDIKSILLYHYPHYILASNNNVEHVERRFEPDEVFDRVSEWEQFEGYDHNLFPPEQIYLFPPEQIY